MEGHTTSIYGYVRGSAAKQSLQRQIRNIEREYPGAIVVQEADSGTKLDRKEWGKLFGEVKEGDTIVFDSVIRMSRNAEDGFPAYVELFRRGVSLVFLKEHLIDTSTYKKAMESIVSVTGTAADFTLQGIKQSMRALAKEQIRLAFEQAEKEAEDLRQRTRAGIQAARLQGKQIGQRPGAKLTTKKSIAAKEMILKYAKDFGGTWTDVEVMKRTGLARNTYYKYKGELRNGSKTQKE